MTTQSTSPSSVLGTELTEALERSLETSIHSLSSLRTAVRVYAVESRRRGLPLDSLIRAAAKMLSEAEEGRVTHVTPSPARDSALANQLRAWCKEDYASAG